MAGASLPPPIVETQGRLDVGPLETGVTQEAGQPEPSRCWFVWSPLVRVSRVFLVSSWSSNPYSVRFCPVAVTRR